MKMKGENPPKAGCRRDSDDMTMTNNDMTTLTRRQRGNVDFFTKSQWSGAF